MISDALQLDCDVQTRNNLPQVACSRLLPRNALQALVLDFVTQIVHPRVGFDHLPREDGGTLFQRPHTLTNLFFNQAANAQHILPNGLQLVIERRACKKSC